MSRTWHILAFLAFVAVPTVGTADDTDPEPPGKIVTTRSGLKYEDLKVGKGRAAKKGDRVQVHYTGWLAVKGKKGKQFDSSRDRGQPFEFHIGQGKVIRGFDEGVVGVKVGGKRLLIIPAKLGYGKQGAGQQIPPDSDLIFEIELVKIND